MSFFFYFIFLRQSFTLVAQAGVQWHDLGSLAINQVSFAKAYNIGVGSNWHIEIKRLGDYEKEKF